MTGITKTKETVTVPAATSAAVEAGLFAARMIYATGRMSAYTAIRRLRARFAMRMEKKMTASEIPTLDECRFRLDGGGFLICQPPSDSLTVRGEGYSRLAAYRDLLIELVMYSYEQCDNDAEIEAVWKRIREAMVAVSGNSSNE